MPRLPLLPAVACLVLLLGGCGRDDASARARRDERPVTVTTTVAHPTAFSDTLQALGTAQARESVTITAKLNETVSQVAFDSGERVRAGQVLVVLGSNAQRADIAEAEAALRDADQQYRRGSELATQQLIARGQVDTLRANRDAARARVQSSRAALSDRVIVAPFAGVLGLRQVSVGALVSPGTQITTLDDLSTIKLDFTVPEGMLGALAPGQPVRATSEAWPGQAFDGRIAEIDTRVDPATRALRVRAELPNPDGKLRPGMLLEVGVVGPERQALLVPEIALVQVGDRTSVYRVKPDHSVEQVEVKVGTRTRGQAELLSGVRSGDRIVVDGTGKLRPGAKVAETAAAAPAVATD